MKEDVINILLNLRKVKIKLLTDEPQELKLKTKGIKEITAKDIETPGQAEILNPEQPIATITNKSTSINITMTVERGLGYISKEDLKGEKNEIGAITMDAFFTPIRRVSYDVENMRVGDRTDFNRLKIFIETDGTIFPREALEDSIDIMIRQLKAIVGFKEEEIEEENVEEEKIEEEKKNEKEDIEFLKTRIDSLDLSVRTTNALSEANIRTVGGLAKKKEVDLLELDGLGDKGLQEIKRALSNFGIVLKQDK